MTDRCDLAIVGAGFAGLACARRAAARGLSVVVLDRQPAPGARIHTTGILVREAWEEWAAPTTAVRRIRKVRLYAPSRRFIEIEHARYFFLATDTAALMHHLTAETRRAGAEIRFGARYRSARPDRKELVLEESDLRCRFLVGADGARSRVAESLGLDRNRRLLKGVEWEFAPATEDGDCLHCFVDPEIAPGYIGWVVPGVGITQVGLALHRHLQADMPRFVQRIESQFGFAERSVRSRRGGVIPIGGLLHRIHAERALLIGDAAGMVSPLTGGGIHNAYRMGRIAADAIADHLAGRGPHPGPVVRRAYPNSLWKRAARWSYDHLPTGLVMEAGMRSQNLVRRVAERVFFGGSPSR